VETLRRVDWRFLVGRARFGRVACDTGTDLTSAVSAVCDEVVGTDSPAACSVAVLSNPTTRTLRRVHQQLEAHGICYSEWTRPGSKRHVRALERAGFTVHGCYALWPPPRRASPLFWLPLSRPRGVDSFLAHRPLPRRRTKRLAALVARATWRLARRRGLLAPVAVLAAKTDGTEDPPEWLASTLLAGWEHFGVGARPRSLACLMLTGGRSDLNKIVILVFADDDREPRFAVKLARTAGSIEGLRREAASLQVVAHTAVAEVADVPQCLFAECLAGTFAVGETVVDGEPVQLDLTPRTYRDVSVRVGGMLRALVPQTEGSPPAAWWPRVIAPVLDEFREDFGSMVDARCIDEVEAQLRRLPPLPVVPEQRDCSPWNLLATPEGRLALLDWESAEPNGLPLLDLYYFLVNAAFVAEGTLGSERETSTYQSLKDERTVYGRVFSEIVEDYARGLALDATARRGLLAFMWMLHAVGEYQRALASIPEDDLDRTRTAARASRFLALWQHEVQDATAV
jgi:hypothetical protein